MPRATGNKETDAIAEIALRAHIEPARTAKRRRRADAWPSVAMILTTVAVPAEGEPLWFGAYSLACEHLSLADRPRLFFRDDLPRRDIDALRAFAATRGWPDPIPRSEFLKRFFRHVYKDRLPLVCFCAAEDVCRLAADWGRGTGDYADGFSLILWTRPAPRSRRLWLTSPDGMGALRNLDDYQLVLFARRAGVGRSGNPYWQQETHRHAWVVSAPDFRREELTKRLSGFDPAWELPAYHLRKAWPEHDVVVKGETIATELAEELRKLLPVVAATRPARS